MKHARSRWYIHNDLEPLHHDRVGLGDIRAASRIQLWCGIDGSGLLALDSDLIAPYAHTRRVEPGLSSANVEFPAVPGAAQHLVHSTVVVLTRAWRADQTSQGAGT